MTSYSSLLSAIAALYNQRQQPDLISATRVFPFKEMYSGQAEALKEIIALQRHADEQIKVLSKKLTTEKNETNKTILKKELARLHSIGITSHTGSGKTPVFLSLTRDQSSLIIEPRKFLQKQVQVYWKDQILFGKSEYQCFYAPNAALSPCQKKTDCDDTPWHIISTGEFKSDIPKCEKVTDKCLDEPCQIFFAEGEYQYYPCRDCEYISAMIKAKKTLHDGGTLVCNFGNFWKFIRDAHLIVIDEADLFFKEISKPVRLKYSKPKKNDEDSSKTLLTTEKNEFARALNDAPAHSMYQIQNAIYNVDFLLKHHDLCFKYQRKDKIYIEVNPDNIGILKDLIFKDKHLIIVSATLPEIDIPHVSYSIPQRAGIFYAPVGKLTSRNLSVNGWIMNVAAKQIETLADLMSGQYQADKVVVHCGNIGNHATKLYDLLGHEQCELHEKGNIMRTIDRFTTSDLRYLLVASAEYGADFGWCRLQFVLKFPYASLDEKMRTLEKTLGKERFNKFYITDAVTRFVQQCGRNTRGFGDFGVTIVQDSKFMEVYRQHNQMFPDWFKARFDGKVY